LNHNSHFLIFSNLFFLIFKTVPVQWSIVHAEGTPPIERDYHASCILGVVYLLDRFELHLAKEVSFFSKQNVYCWWSNCWSLQIVRRLRPSF